MAGGQDGHLQPEEASTASAQGADGKGAALNGLAPARPAARPRGSAPARQSVHAGRAHVSRTVGQPWAWPGSRDHTEGQEDAWEGYGPTGQDVRALKWPPGRLPRMICGSCGHERQLAHRGEPLACCAQWPPPMDGRMDDGHVRRPPVAETHCLRGRQPRSGSGGPVGPSGVGRRTGRWTYCAGGASFR